MKWITAVMVLAVAACSAPVVNDAQGRWQLVVSEVGGHPFEALDEHPIVLVVGEIAIEGDAGCNTYASGGPWLVDGTVDLGVVTQTAAACEESDGAPVMAIEQAYFRALGGVDSYGLENGVLLLTGPDVTLRYARTG